MYGVKEIKFRKNYENKSEVEITELIYKNYIEHWIKDDPTQWLWAHKRWS